MLSMICLLFVGCAGAVCSYHIGMGLVGLFCIRSASKRSSEAKHRFAIVIPAHNEQAVLGTALRSCAELDYPSDRYQVFVIADNCDDMTAEIAVSHGADCLERFDADKMSKGHALQWAFPRILSDGYDAILVLDADCRLNAVALRTFDWYLSRGHQVLQANDVVANPDENPLSYLLAVANVLENDLFYLPKSLLGLSVFLRGTGMVFHRDVLSEIPWNASSPVEDTEYSCRLMQRGIHITFAPDARVASDFPYNNEELTIQRERWIGGAARIAKTFGMQLIGRGLATANTMLIDAGWTLYITLRPIVIIQLFLTCFLCLLNLVIYPGLASSYLVAACVGIVIMYGAYVVAGVFRLGVSLHRMGLALKSPWLTVRYVGLALRTLVLGAGRVWRPALRRENVRPLAK